MMDQNNLMDYFSPSNWVRRPNLLAGTGMYLLAIIGVFVSGIVLALLYQLIPGISPQWQLLISTVLIEFGIIGLIPYVHMRRHPGVEKSYRFNRPSVATLLLVAVLAVVVTLCSYALTALWSVFIESLGGTLLPDDMPVPTNAGELVFLFVLIALIPAVCEEFLFRGALLSAWERRGKARALVVSSLLFALMHGSIIALPAHIMAGFALGAVVLISDSIYSGMLFHFIYNGFMVWNSYRAAQVEMPSDSGVPIDMLNALGGAQGLALLIQELALLLGVCALLLWGLKKANAKKERPALKMRDRSPLGWREVLVLMAAAISVIALYALDLLTIFPLS